MTLRPMWIACEDCDGFLCVIHGQHVHECECPDVDELATLGVDPYTQSLPVASEAANLFSVINKYFRVGPTVLTVTII